MQSILFKWFVFTAMVIVILNALNGGECVEIPVDTCAVEMIKNKELPGIYCSTCNYSRAETPTSAGKEGINLNGGHLYLPIDEFVREHTDNVTCGLKFFVNLPPRPADDTMFLLYWGFSLKQFSNGSIHFKYDLFDPVATKTVYRSLSVDIPEKDDFDDSDWIELVGIKVKLSEREKRDASSGDSGETTADPLDDTASDDSSETTADPFDDIASDDSGETTADPFGDPASDDLLSEDKSWVMVGLDYEKHPNAEGHFNLFLNGELVHNGVVEPQYRLVTVEKYFKLEKYEFSCLEFHKGTLPANYFKDFNLNECKTKYQDMPAQNFLDCEKDLKSPALPNIVI